MIKLKQIEPFVFTEIASASGSIITQLYSASGTIETTTDTLLYAASGTLKTDFETQDYSASGTLRTDLELQDYNASGLFLKKDGSTPLTENWDSTKNILASGIYATSSSGVFLYNNLGTYGLFVSDAGVVTTHNIATDGSEGFHIDGNLLIHRPGGWAGGSIKAYFGDKNSYVGNFYGGSFTFLSNNDIKIETTGPADIEIIPSGAFRVIKDGIKEATAVQYFHQASGLAGNALDMKMYFADMKSIVRDCGYIRYYLEVSEGINDLDTGIRFATRKGSTVTEAMVIDSAQNVGFSGAITSYKDITSTQYLHASGLLAVDSGGLKLFDDGGNGIFVKNGGFVGVGIEPEEKLHIARTAGNCGQQIDCYSDSTHIPYVQFRKSHNDTLGTKTTTVSGRGIGYILFQGVDDGNNFDYGARIKALQNGAAGVTVPTDLIFSTYSDTTENTNQLVLHHDGNVGVGVVDSHSKLEVNGAISSSTLTTSAEGPTDNLNVSGVNTVFIDAGSNNVTIGGTIGGVNGQLLNVVVHTSGNIATIEHNEGVNQSFLLHLGADESLNDEYGGWQFVNHEGAHWHDCSHAKHT